jgi:hypothetical protein
MAILIQRFRLRFVWLLTGHPRFKPLYHRDVVSPNLLEQADFLASAGYYTAAVMLCRAAIEGQVKRYAMITKHWAGFRRKQTVADMANVLQAQNRINKDTSSKICRFYTLASGVAHGELLAAERHEELIRDAHWIIDQIEKSRKHYLMSDRAAFSMN